MWWDVWVETLWTPPASSTRPHLGQTASEAKVSRRICTPQSLQWSDLYGLATMSVHLKQTPFARIKASSSITCAPQSLQQRVFTNRSLVMVIYKQNFLFNWTTQHLYNVNRCAMSLKRTIALLQDANKKSNALESEHEDLKVRYKRLYQDYMKLSDRLLCQDCVARCEKEEEGGCTELCTRCSFAQSLHRGQLKRSGIPRLSMTHRLVEAWLSGNYHRQNTF